MADEIKQEEQQGENWKVHSVDDTRVSFFFMSEEAAILLNDTPLLCGIYVNLLYLHRQGFLMGRTQEEIANKLKISRPSLQTYLEQLEQLGLISVTKSKFSNTRKNIQFNRVRRLPENQIERLGKVSGVIGQNKVLEDLKKQITITPLEQIKEAKELEQADLFIQESISTQVKEGVKKALDKQKGRDQKFPVADYVSVLDGYRKYKGIFIKPHSPDEARYRKAAKNMFLSGWKVLDILECLKFFNSHCRSEGYEWMNNWTLETVGKKIAEFKAGNLKKPELGDDLPEYTG